MPLPQIRRTKGLKPNNNCENPTKAVKNAPLAVSRVTRRVVLHDIKPCNSSTDQPTTKIPVAAKTITKSEIVTDVIENKENTQLGYSTIQIDNFLDIDRYDTKNPFLVTDYVQDIFAYLQQLEQKFKIQENHLSDNVTTPRMRSVLVNWIVDVCISFKFLQETLHLTIAILDRYLQVNKTIGRTTLQLVGIASMLIAAKYEEIYVPDVTDFVYVCDDTFSAVQIFKMEKDILAELKFNLGRPLPLLFLRRYSKIARYSITHHNMAKYLSDISLLEYKLCSIDPSLQAAASCCLSMLLLKDTNKSEVAWNEVFEHYSTYKYSDVKPVMLKLLQALCALKETKFQAITKKYAVNNLGCISEHDKLKLPNLLELIKELSLTKN